jgi:diguanylate cyclase (GGDEF)-like protein
MSRLNGNTAPSGRCRIDAFGHVPRCGCDRYRAVRADLRTRRIGSLRAALIVLFVMCCDAHAQQFSFRPYTPAEGLTNLAVGHLALGANSDLWVGTDGGLFRYDGTSFEPFDTASGLPPDQVGGVQTDPWGGVWVNLVRGLYTRPPGASRFVAVRTAEGAVRADFRTPIALLGPDRVLVLVGGQIVELQRHNDSWHSHAYLTPNQSAALSHLGSVRRLLLGVDGTLWLSCGRQVCSVSGGTLRVWGEADGVLQDDWNTYLEDLQGRLWVRSPQHLLVHERNAQTFTLRDPPLPELDEIRTNLAMVLDPRGRLLVRTGGGLARWDDPEWKQFTFANGLPAASISDAQLDAEGNVWLGLNGLGLWRWRNYDNLESWTRAQGLISDKIWSILRDPEGRLLLGSSNGCQMLDEQAAHVVSCPVEGLPRRTLHAMAVDGAETIWWGFNNGEIWNTPAGDAHAHLIFPAAAERPEISMIYFDISGVGWIACLDGGLFRLDPHTARLDNVSMPGGPARIYDITEDAHRTLWVAGSSGLFRKDGDRWSLMHANDPAGVATVFGSVAATPDGSIWGASDGKGLLRASASTFERREWVQEDIVAHASVYFVRADARGWVWLGTDQGAVVFDGQLWRRIDQEDGLIWNDTQVYGFLADGDGSVWIGTSAGLTHIRDPQNLMGAPKALDLNIARAQLGGEAIDPHGKTILPWRSDAAFDVHLSSHSFSRSAQTEFRYRLVGLSSKWFGSRSPEIHVPALAAGNYRLEVIAVDEPHARTSPTISMSFNVLPPWWRTVAFRVVMALFAGLLLALAWRWQVLKFRARRTILETEFRERQALLERATRDALTGLWNRATILDVLARETLHAQRTGLPLSVAIVDVDHFKHINDNYGHLRGDEVLRELSHRLTAQLRQGDWLGRYGGEELMLVLPGGQRAEVEVAAERLCKCVADEAFIANGQSLQVTVSIGIARCESPADKADDILGRADAALYEAKRAGRNRVAYAMGTHTTDSDSSASRRYLSELFEKVKGEAEKRSHEAK